MKWAKTYYGYPQIALINALGQYVEIMIYPASGKKRRWHVSISTFDDKIDQEPFLPENKKFHSISEAKKAALKALVKMAAFKVFK